MIGQDGSLTAVVSVFLLPRSSWESWWDEEHGHIKSTGFMERLIEVVPSLKFFIYQYGIVSLLIVVQNQKKHHGTRSLFFIKVFTLILISFNGSSDFKSGKMVKSSNAELTT